MTPSAIRLMRRFAGSQFRAAQDLRVLADALPSVRLARPYSMLHEARLISLHEQVRELLARGVAGDFVECGVWRGGASFLMANLIRASGADKRVWMFDSFEGLPPPDPKVDGAHALNWSAASPWYFNNNTASLEEVRHAACILGLSGYVVPVKGWFDQTLPERKAEIGSIALLRVDGDWHSSVKTCLIELWDQVVTGGVVVIDDYYDWDGCALAVHEFLGERGLACRLMPVMLTSGQPSCVYVRKS